MLTTDCCLMSKEAKSNSLSPSSKMTSWVVWIFYLQLVKVVNLTFFTIFDENAFQALVIELCSFLHRCMHICNVAKSFQTDYIQLDSCPTLLRCLIQNNLHVTTISHINSSLHCLHPKMFRNIFSFHHGFGFSTKVRFIRSTTLFYSRV